MRSSKNENITKEEHLYIKLAAYSALIEFNQHILPVLSNFNQIINSTVYILSMQMISQKLGYKKKIAFQKQVKVLPSTSATANIILFYMTNGFRLPIYAGR